MEHFEDVRTLATKQSFDWKGDGANSKSVRLSFGIAMIIGVVIAAWDGLAALIRPQKECTWRRKVPFVLLRQPSA